MKPIAKRSKGLRVLAAVGGLAIAAGLALAVDALRGDPLSRAWAEAPGHCPGRKSSARVRASPCWTAGAALFLTTA